MPGKRLQRPRKRPVALKPPLPAIFPAEGFNELERKLADGVLGDVHGRVWTVTQGELTPLLFQQQNPPQAVSRILIVIRKKVLEGFRFGNANRRGGLRLVLRTDARAGRNVARPGRNDARPRGSDARAWPKSRDGFCPWARWRCTGDLSNGRGSMHAGFVAPPSLTAVRGWTARSSAFLSRKAE